ncbi:MAG: hypothetical protein OER96_00435 [Gammaproteobacteria bacterium]|nr:hypothetical protein [Gammaproteobacteria bacterium]
MTKYSYSTARFFILTLAVIALLILLGGCASFGHKQSASPNAVYVAQGDVELSRYAPMIMHENDTESFNQIGTPVVKTSNNGKPRVRIDSTTPTIYANKRAFTSVSGEEFTNYIYRIHFEKVPFSVIPFHVTAGRNGGLFIITTVDDRGQPLLYTTVHTCGCYLAFVPTQYMPDNAYLDNWPESSQRVFGETLPVKIELTGENRWPVVMLRDGTHRVANIEARNPAVLRHHRVIRTPLRPLTSLRHLPSDDGPVSMFQTKGLREGYVRSIFKPFELLLISWWAFDLNVGIDKMYGDADVTGTRFYTSLKPWARKKSDMWQFAEFLDYWGWKL